VVGIESAFTSIEITARIDRETIVTKSSFLFYKSKKEAKKATAR